MRLAAQINKQFDSSVIRNCWDTELTCLQLREMIQHEIKPFHALVRIVRDLKPTEKKPFMISGVYDPERSADKNITIYLHFSKARKSIKMSRSRLNKLIFLVIQTLQHELVHRHSNRKVTQRIKVQYSKMLGKKQREDVNYLTDHDEIDAYAHDIAMEIKQYYGHLSNSETFNKLDQLKRLQSYRMYRETFDGLDWTEVRKALMKRIWKWLPEIIPVKLIAS